ncbi:MAG: DUF1573 domain-containing protein [Bacteroidales bacterium]
MKKIAMFVGILLTALFVIFVGNNESRAESASGPKLVFKAEDDRIDLDTLNLEFMEDIRLEIEFENKGNEPLIVHKVNGCCGTNIEKWTESPLRPGEKGTIVVQFREPAKPHRINRTIKALSNDPEGAKTVSIEGTVQEQEDGSVQLEDKD